MVITSFSQKALLSSLYQNYLNPPKCDLKIVQQPAESLLDTLQNPQHNLGFDPFTAKLRADPLHKTFGPPVRALARMVYMIGVATLIAPLGVIWHISNAVLNIANRQKAREHAYCAYTDLWVIGRTAGACFMSVGGIWFVWAAFMGELPRCDNSISKRVIGVLGGLVMGILSSPIYFLGGTEQDSAILKAVGHRENCIAMCMSLRLHRELGLSGPNGEPLPFASKDNFQVDGKGEVKDNDGKPSALWGELHYWITSYECDLAFHAGQANQYINAGSKLKYGDFFDAKGVFDETKIINSFERLAGSSTNKDAINKLVTEMQLIHRRKSFFMDLLKYTAKLACENASSDSNQRKRKWAYNHPNMYSIRGINERYFNQTTSSTNPQRPATDLSKILKDIEPSNQNRGVSFANYSIDKFKAQVQYAKLCIVKGQTPPNAYELLGLKSDYTEHDLTHAYRRYAINIHPDKNPNNQATANQLFQCLNEIEELLRRKFPNV